MEIDIKNLPKSPALLEEMIVALQAELTAYKEKYARLIEEIALAKQQRFSPSSEKNIFQSDLFDEPGNELTEELKEQLDDEIEVKDHVRKKHPVRRSLPKEFPREIVVHDISELEKVCPCGSVLVRIGEEITQQLN